MAHVAWIGLRAKPLRWLPAASVGAAHIGVMFMGSTMLTPLYVLYQHEHGFSRLTLTLVYAAYVIGNLTALFVLGRLSDQVGRRSVALPTVALAAVATLVFMSDFGTASLFLGRVLRGLAIGVASGTATARVTELVPGQNKGRASVLATGGNFVGLALGPIVAGLLARYAPWPLESSFVVYLALLASVALLIRLTPETVAHTRDIEHVSLKPRIGVPRELRSQFVAPGVTAFATFALVGYYAALLPSLLAEDFGQRSPAVAGLVVAEIFVIAAVTVVTTQRLDPRKAMLSGLVLFLPSLGFFVSAELERSMTLLVTGATFAGVAVALGYRGSLQVINAMAPNERRAELISSYLLICYLANSLPIIGVGVLAQAYRLANASYVFAATIAVLAVAALVVGLRRAPPTVRA